MKWEYSNFKCSKCPNKYVVKTGLLKHERENHSDDTSRKENEAFTTSTEPSTHNSTFVEFDDNVLLIDDLIEVKICSKCNKAIEYHSNGTCPLEIIKCTESKRNKIHFKEASEERPKNDK